MDVVTELKQVLNYNNGNNMWKMGDWTNEGASSPDDAVELKPEKITLIGYLCYVQST